MKKSPENFIHPETLTTELAAMDNIAHAILELEATVRGIKDCLQSIEFLLTVRGK